MGWSRSSQTPCRKSSFRMPSCLASDLKTLNNGALLIVAPTEHKVRIEVGYGLEPILTDALSEIIIQNAILPSFRSEDAEQWRAADRRADRAQGPHRSRLWVGADPHRRLVGNHHSECHPA